MKAIIVEDELNVREGFIKLMKAFCPEIEVVGVADSVESGIKVIDTLDFDILFLDINLPDGSGFDLVHRLVKRDFQIIFVTAYDQYAIDAFKISAVDYLLKPVSPDLLKKAVNKVIENSHDMSNQKFEVLSERLNKKYEQSEKIILRGAESMQIVVISDILYCEAEGSYTTFHLFNDGRIMTSLNLKEYERLLEPYGFVRNHHSYMINLHQVKSISRSDGGIVTMTNGDNLPLSTRKKSTVIEALRNQFVN